MVSAECVTALHQELWLSLQDFGVNRQNGVLQEASTSQLACNSSALDTHSIAEDSDAGAWHGSLPPRSSAALLRSDTAALALAFWELHAPSQRVELRHLLRLHPLLLLARNVARAHARTRTGTKLSFVPNRCIVASLYLY